MQSINKFRQHPPPLSAPTFSDSGRFCRFPLLRGLPKTARGSHAPPEWLPHYQLLHLCCCYFCVCLFVFLDFFVVLLSPYFGILVIVTQYTYEITFNGDPDFVASVHRVNESASSEALPRVLSFVVYILNCLLYLFFIFCCNCL
jgi:hypothetical protein